MTTNTSRVDFFSGPVALKVKHDCSNATYLEEMTAILAKLSSFLHTAKYEKLLHPVTMHVRKWPLTIPNLKQSTDPALSVGSHMRLHAIATILMSTNPYYDVFETPEDI